MFLKELNQPITVLNGVGTATAQKLSKLFINNLSDLLQYFPRDYEDRRLVTKISHVNESSKFLIEASVIKQEWFNTKKGRVLSLYLSDGTGNVVLMCFGRPVLDRSLKIGDKLRVFAGFSFVRGRWTTSDFEYEEFSKFKPADFGSIIPVYSLTSGIRMKMLRNIIYKACLFTEGLSTSWDVFCIKRELLPVTESLLNSHFPTDWKKIEMARQSLAYVELLQFQLSVKPIRVVNRKRLPRGRKITNRVIERLPFNLTDEQAIVLDQIKKESRKNRPMEALLQGEVGCGKTLVALLAAAEVISSGEQVVMLVPTDLLARQHADTAYRIFSPFGINVGVLSRSVLLGSQRQQKLKLHLLKEAVRKGEINLLIGTHIILKADLSFLSLGFVIIDEQHRFGVSQRQYLLKRDPVPDLLLMTATPIPRSLALTLFGHLKLFTIYQLPSGRIPVKTFIAKFDDVSKIYFHVKKEVKSGNQAFFVVPSIGPSASRKAVHTADGALAFYATIQRIFSEYKVGLIHSKVEDTEQQSVMNEFRKGEISILVATTVVEVGVDVPDATCMVVMAAERFGLATLHQLRGRVGRGDKQSFFFLVYQEQLSAKGKKRLVTMRNCNDGFLVAEKDLEERGPGELKGLRQSGLFDFRIVDLSKDIEIAKLALADAKLI